MMDVVGYVCALAIGAILGLIGGGGAILTVPVLVYLLDVPPVLATAYSLFIVGTSALVGSVNYARQDLVDFKTAVLFGLPSLVSVFLTRKLLMPAIPDVLFNVGAFAVSKGALLMVLFAVLMVLVSTSMIKPTRPRSADNEKTAWQKGRIVLTEGFVVGALTGLVGAGGGFLIVPALVVVTGIGMKKAIGTSLLIIAAKSLGGFVGDVSNYAMDWTLLLSFAALAIVGMFIGTRLGKFIPAQKLKAAFGWFVLAAGSAILVKEIFSV